MAVVFEGEVPACYWTFYLFSSDDEAGLDPELAFAGQRNGLCGAGASGALTLRSGVHSGRVGLTVEQLPEPPPADPRWDDIVEVPFQPDGTTAEIIDWDGVVHARFTLEPVPYRVRYCAAGLDAGFAADTRLDGDPELDRIALQFWPAPPRPDEIIKQTSETAGYWHAEAQRLPSHQEIAQRRTQRAAEALQREEAQREELRRCHEEWQEQQIWGGPRPAAPLGDIANAAGVVKLDRGLAEALAASTPAQQRAITLWTVRRTVADAGLGDVDWVANAVTALEHRQPLPAPFDARGSAWRILFDDDRVEHTKVTSLDRQHDDVSRQSGALAAVQAAGATSDPTEAVFGAIYQAVHAYGAAGVTDLLAALRRAFPDLTVRMRR
ncbi:hypothetical protein K1T35_48210 (plasmid) [Pseudonocardia sp. DSM 110487]|uniref:hypothetical protein n=1 Tax=Pseudonocardia sp. DSM 110487 TaxID=2865833 RepID=UPI001C6A7C11|nr:hypothetical protein [Pseudonocardia sp. DSM 110487]QYN41133.1 hypothetical protein K1T35_48210 [Pseudonocardia sp. DSM 110487]